MKLWRLISLSILAMLLMGCLGPKSYLDPSAPKVNYSDLKKANDPVSLRLVTVFERNGEAYPKADATLRDNSSRVLRATGLIDPDGANSVGTIKITVNNIADVGAARAKGFGTGLTFGAIGTTVTDNYELTMVIDMNNKTITKSGIKNSIATAIGNTPIPAGAEVLTPSLAFQKVLEQMILQALKEVQAEPNAFSANTFVLTGTYKQKLEQLQGLRKEGLIGDKEFQQQKKSLVSDK